MIIAKIVQQGQIITLEDKLTTFQYSANLQMQFIKDNRYKDYTLVGFYKPFKNNERLLSIDEDGIFTLGADVFKENGTVYFSFSLNKADGEIIHLGVIEYAIRQSFGNGDAILPEEQDTWISVVSTVVKEQVSDIWDKDCKPQLEQNINIIETMTEEINAAAAEVKQDALESSVNAKSALDSANLAKNSANNAKMAEEKALEHSTNAEQFKNDASNYANQANTAKVEAQQCATDASNSASSALDSANKAKDHLDSIVEKTDAFNTSVENANTDLDKIVLDANNELDKKIVDTNSVMDAKVTEATAQANIATSKAEELKDAVDKVNRLEDIVDTKLTQPYVSSSTIENATISDSDEGQLRNLKIYGKCTQKIETDIVPTPSRPIPIFSKRIKICKGENLFNTSDVVTNDTLSVGDNSSITITNTYGCSLGIKYVFDQDTDLYAYYKISDDGSKYYNLLLHNTSNTANNVTLPINRHVTVKAGEYKLFAYGLESGIRTYSNIVIYRTETVELRSLKETENLFDIKMYGFNYGVVNSSGVFGNSRDNVSTGFIEIKPNTTYAKSEHDGWSGVSKTFYDKDKNFISNSLALPFTTPNNAKYFRLCLSKSSITQEDIDMLNNDFVVVEGTTVPSTYVAPTIRDYKIVDHVNKKSWIERNIQEVNLNNLNFVYSDAKTDYTRFYAPLNPTVKHVGEIYSNSFPSYKSYDYTKEAIYGGNTSGGKTLSVIVKDSNVAEHTKEALLNYINNPNAVAYYALETPIIEEIPYVESDISEFGVSSQDSISPSPTIPSELEFVNKIENEEISKIEIKTVGINLLSNKLEHWYFRKALGWGASTGTPVPKPNTFSNVGYSAVIEVNGILPNTKYSFYNADTKNLWVSRIIEMDSDYIGCCNHRLYDNVETDNKEFYAFTTSVHTTKLFLQIRTCPITGNGASRDIEEKDIANMQITLTLDEVKKHYNYLETVVSHTLANPLLSIKEYRDTIDLNTEERKNYIYELPKELITTDVVSIYKKSNNCIRFGIYNSRFIPHMLRDTEAVICNMFKTLKAPWSLDVESIHVHDDYLFHFYISVNKNRLTGYNDNLTDAEIINLFKEFIQNADIRIWWVLAEPTVEPLDPELVEKLKTLKTFYPITHIISNVPLEFAYKLNMPAWHKVVSGQVEDARDVIYNMQVQQNNLEVMQLQSALETQYNLDLLKLGGNLC